MKPQQIDRTGDRLNAIQHDEQGDPITPFITMQSDIDGFAATLITPDGRVFTTGRFYPTKNDAINAIGDYYFALEYEKLLSKRKPCITTL